MQVFDQSHEQVTIGLQHHIQRVLSRFPGLEIEYRITENLTLGRKPVVNCLIDPL